MKVSKILGHYDNAAYEMNFNIRMKEEGLKITEAEILKFYQLVGKPELIPLPVVMVVIHDMLVDIANKTGKDLDSILKLINETELKNPIKLEDKIKYELR